MVQWQTFVQHLLLVCCVLAATYTDVRKLTIPNRLTFGFALSGLLFHSWIGWSAGLLSALWGLSVGLLLFLPFYLLGALGAGDVKLFAAIGAIAGSEFVVQAMVYSMLCAFIISLMILIRQSRLLSTLRLTFHSFVLLIWFKDLSMLQPKSTQTYTRFPFMYAALPGVWLASVIS